MGNHDLDLGLEKGASLNAKTNFPWLLSNVVKVNGERIVNTHEYQIIKRPGWRIGLIGLAEYGWMASLNSIDVDEIIYEDYTDCATRLALMLREEMGCNIVIALTHMRVNNDQQLATECPDIDLILGGHDHCYHAEVLNKIFILKSGSDYKSYSEIDIIQGVDNSSKTFDNLKIVDNAEVGKTYSYLTNNYSLTLAKHEITKDIEPLPDLVLHVQHYNQLMNEAMKKTVCKILVPCDTTFTHVRSQECLIGNFVVDLMRKHFSADCALLNSGTFRSDVVY